MGRFRILLISESEPVLSELSACLEERDVSAELTLCATAKEMLSGHCPECPFDLIIADHDAPVLPTEELFALLRSLHCKCPIYVLFNEVDEEAITAAIRMGATSFALRTNLGSIASTIHKRSDGANREPVIRYPENSHQILKAFLEESTDSIWVKDKHGKYLLINQAGADFIGKPIGEILGRTDYDVFQAETAHRVCESDQNVMEAGKTETVEDLIITLDGIPRTFQAVKGVFRDEQGDIQGVIGTVRDISLRKRAEEALKESEHRFRLLVEGVKDHAIYMLDPAGRITTWNIGAERLQGYRSEEIIGKHFSCFFAKEDIPQKALQAAIEQGGYEQEAWHIRKDGSKYWANLIITPLYSEHAELLGFSSVIRDITERRAAEEELKYYAAKLAQSNKDLEQFAFIASHDLQAPLRKVKVFSEMLQELAGEDGQDTARRLHAAVNKMQQLISDLLTLSRISRKGKSFQEVFLNTVVAEAMDDLDLVIRETHADITVEPLGVVSGDASQLGQLFQNLLSNSLKYRKPDQAPVIKIKGELIYNNFYQITVQDNGIGFKDQHVERIFRPFERLHGDNEYSGTGMGLAICKKIVERHGGQITATSREGEGSTFIIYLPVQASRDLDGFTAAPLFNILLSESESTAV